MNYDENKLDNLIKLSLKESLEDISFDIELEAEILQSIKKASLWQRIRSILEFEVTIPLPYAIVGCLLITSFLGYNVFGYFPGASEFTTLQLHWKLINFTGVI